MSLKRARGDQKLGHGFRLSRGICSGFQDEHRKQIVSESQ